MERSTRDQMIKRLIYMKRISNTKARGKMRSVSAMVIMGDGNGTAGQLKLILYHLGYGEGKAVDPVIAIEKAFTDAKQKMFTIPRFDNRTIHSNVDHMFQSTNIKLWTAHPGYGVVSNSHIHEICRCFGIKDIGSKIYGSTNPMNVVKATFEALKSIKSPEEIAKLRGLKAVDVVATYFGVKKFQ